MEKIEKLEEELKELKSINFKEEEKMQEKIHKEELKLSKGKKFFKVHYVNYKMEIGTIKEIGVRWNREMETKVYMDYTSSSYICSFENTDKLMNFINEKLNKKIEAMKIEEKEKLEIINCLNRLIIL